MKLLMTVFQNEFMEMLLLRIWREVCPNQDIGHIDFQTGHRNIYGGKKKNGSQNILKWTANEMQKDNQNIMVQICK